MNTLYQNSALSRFLLEHHVGAGQEFSMTGMGIVKGKMYISDDEYPKFLDYMEEYLFKKRGVSCNLIEHRRPDCATPLLIDLDFKYENNKGLKRAFTKEHIQSFIRTIVDVLNEMFDLTSFEKIRFFVTLRGEPYLDKKKAGRIVKDGIHILCPEIVLTSDLQKVLRASMLQKNAVSTSFKHTDYVDKDETVFDETLTIKNGWFFYGESKPDIPAYTLEHVICYSAGSNEYSEEAKNSYTSRQLLELLSIRYNLPDPIVPKEDYSDELTKILETVNRPPPVSADPVNVEPFEDSAWQPWLRSAMPESEVELAKQFADKCLSVERADNEESWMRVGWCLRNIEASDEMFTAWMKFSSKSPKFAENNIEQLRRNWIRGSMQRIADKKLLTIRSLHKWAREDNPDMYNDILKHDIYNYIKKVGITYKGGTHHHIACIMFKLFSDRYRCSVDQRTIEWFEFKDHFWSSVPQGLDVKVRLHTEVAEHICEARNTLPKDGKTEEEMKKQMEHITKLMDMEKNLYSSPFKDSVIKECVQLFFDEDFMKKMNQNPYLLGCANGILHLRDPTFDAEGKPVSYKAVLKPGLPGDYVSFQLGHSEPDHEAIEYTPYDPADPRQADIMDFMAKLFPDEELREFVLTLSAGCLEGANIEQYFYILTGSGGNGKSKYMDLMRMTLGDYLSSLSTAAITRKRPESGAANPDMISIKSRRCIIMQEPDEREAINTARMKQLSGEDIVEARGLFKDQERFKISGKFFMCCNRLPPIHSMDGGTWRRLKVIPFNSKFVVADDPTLDPSNHVYLRDTMLDEKLKLWREPFLALLVHYYETRYCPHGITKIPSIVNQFSMNYKNNNDGFEKFIGSRIRLATKYACIAGNTVTKSAIMKAIRNWRKIANIPLTDGEAVIRLVEKFNEPADNKTYQHIRLFETDEDTEDFDQEDCGDPSCKGHAHLRE